MSQFKELVKQMRKAQRQYFATRDREWLREAKRLEKEVDKALSNNLFAEAEYTESDLFAAFKQGRNTIGDLLTTFKQWKNTFLNENV